jgi:hypothetical protein
MESIDGDSGHPARQRRDGEEIHRDEGGEVVGEEGPPRLGRWTRPLRQQSRHGALGDLNPTRGTRHADYFRSVAVQFKTTVIGAVASS